MRILHTGSPTNASRLDRSPGKFGINAAAMTRDRLDVTVLVFHASRARGFLDHIEAPRALGAFARTMGGAA